MSTRRTALLLLIAAPLAASATNSTTTRRRNAKARNHPQDNGETRADRDRRLARECRHLPNAGACQGFGYGS